MNDLRVVAITHKNFPLETIGKFHVADEKRKEILTRVKEMCGMGEIMYLSTCNRVEFIFTLPHYVCPGVTAQMLAATGVELSEEELRSIAAKAERHNGAEAAEHLLNVAASLESAIIGEREIITVNAALGDRDFEFGGQFVTAPEAGRPDEYKNWRHRHIAEGTIHDFMEERVVKARSEEQLDGTPGDGQTVMWARLPQVIDGVDAATLGVLGDFVPRGVGQALGIRGGGNSLDNTLRVMNLVPTTWVLLDIRVQGVARGFGHGLVHMFAEDGTLMATASQSCIVRMWKGD